MSHVCGAGSCPYFAACSALRSSCNVCCGNGAGCGRATPAFFVAGRRVTSANAWPISMSPSACFFAPSARLWLPLARRVAFGVSARTRARASSSMERRSESFAIVNVSADAFEIGFGVERGHASRAGGRHRLPIHMIGNIACGKHTRHRRRGRVALAAALDADIAAGHVELTLEDLRIRRVADRDENALHRQLVGSVALEVAYAHAGPARFVADDIIDHT